MRTAGTSAVDVVGPPARVDSGGASARQLLEVLGAAVSGVLAAVVALPTRGSSWSEGSGAPILGSCRGRGVVRPAPRRAPVRAARVTDEPALAGARRHALLGLQEQVVARVHDAAG